MTRSTKIDELLRNASPATRREFLKRAAVTGISGPAALALLSANPTAAAAAGVSAGQTGLARQQENGEPTQGGTLVLTGHQEVASLSPDDDGPTVHWAVITQIHNALYEMDENYEFQPVLAESHVVSDDGLTYTFTLREGVLFHDGEEFTSEDVKYTYEWYMDPDNAAIGATDFALVESVEAPDDYTVVVNLSETSAAFIAKTATTFIVPAHHHGEIGEEEYKSNPIGTGAFRLVEWRAAEFTLLEAFDDHFRGRPNIDELRMDIVPEGSVRAIGLETGDSDSAVWPLVTEDNVRLAEDPNFQTYITASLSINHFPLNNDHPILSDQLVRQAMMFAIDRQALIDDIFQGTAVLATSNLSPALEAYYEPEVTEYPYDPERAAELLEEAGWVMGDNGIRERDGEPLTFTCTTITGDQARRPEAEVVQQMLLEVGIDMQLAEAPVATILEQMRAGEMDASLYNWTYGGTDGDPDASETLRSNGLNNFSNYRNDRVDELLDLGITELDLDQRAAYYREIQQIVAEEVPFLFIMVWDWYNIFSSRVQGLPESALSGSQIYRKAHEWWLDEG